MTSPFQHLHFVRGDDRALVAVTALCVTCKQERSLTFAEVIGGVALRCAMCDTRELFNTKQALPSSIESFMATLR